MLFKHRGWGKAPLCMSEIPLCTPCSAVHRALLKPVMAPSCAKQRSAAMVDFCHCSPVLPASSVSYCQKCFERDSKDSEIQASRAGHCVCLSFCAVPSTATSQPQCVPLGSPHKTNSILGWVGSAVFCSSAASAGEYVCL